MSPRSWDLRVHDILESISKIESFTKELNAESFQNDEKTYLAVIRCLEIIGEASNHIPEDVKNNFPDIPWRKIKDFRNILVHEYFGVDSDIVWNTIQNDLPGLKKQIEKLNKA